MDELDTLHAQYQSVARVLYGRAMEDLAGAVMPGQSYEVRVSGTPSDSVTEWRAANLDRAHTYTRVTHRFERLVGDLRKLCDELGVVTPEQAAADRRREVARRFL